MNKLDNITYHVLRIVRGTTVDGPGFRTSIYLAGCCHRCPGCHNPKSWDSEAGDVMTLQEIMNVVKEEDFNVTLTGGDPLFNARTTAILIHELKRNRRNVWVYTGYKWEDIVSSENLYESIKEADVIVDGEYIESLRNLDLCFRGSSNQRIINVPQSIAYKEVVLYNSKL